MGIYRQGKDRLGQVGAAGIGKVRQAWQVWMGLLRYGTLWFGMSSHGKAGTVRFGRASSGMTWFGSVWQAWKGIVWFVWMWCVMSS